MSNRLSQIIMAAKERYKKGEIGADVTEQRLGQLDALEQNLILSHNIYMVVQINAWLEILRINNLLPAWVDVGHTLATQTYIQTKQQCT